MSADEIAMISDAIYVAVPSDNTLDIPCECSLEKAKFRVISGNGWQTVSAESILPKLYMK